MTTAFWWVAGIGLGLVLLAAGLLVWLNFSQQVWIPLITAVLIGVLTFAITFVSTLRSTEEETTFTTSIGEDTKMNLPVFVNPDPAQSAVSVRASEFGTTAMGVFTPGSTIPEPAMPDSDVTTFNLELLQYVMIRTIRDQQRLGWGVGVVLTPEGNVARAGVNRPPTLSDPTSLQGNHVLRILAANRFASSQYERFGWENIRLTIPRGATLTVRSDPGGVGKGPQTVEFRIQRPGYFEVVVTITPIPITGVGAPPEGLHLDPAVRARCSTHHYVVTAKAKFSRLTAGDWRTAENKAWVRWAFNLLQARYGNASGGKA